MGAIPKTPVTRKDDRIDEVIYGLIGYMETEKGALAKLQKEKRGEPLLHLKLQIESAFILQILRNLFHLDPGYVKALVEMIHADPDFPPGVNEFVDHLVPPKSLIITPDEFLRKAGKFELLGG